MDVREGLNILLVESPLHKVRYLINMMDVRNTVKSRETIFATQKRTGKTSLRRHQWAREQMKNNVCTSTPNAREVYNMYLPCGTIYKSELAHEAEGGMMWYMVRDILELLEPHRKM